jgi:adenosylcobinamide-GDP ribazoletransferase
MVGGIVALTFFGLQHIFPLPLTVLLSMVMGILITGAMHEDAFADFCDGFGGGYTKERILAIMKDSSIGVYGAVGVVSILAVKFVALLSINPERIVFSLIAAHTFSRLMPVFLMFTSQYVRPDETAKAKTVGSNASLASLLVAFAVGAASLFLLTMNQAIVILISTTVVFIGFRAYVIKRTGGYTGDVLGALQQITEVVMYLVMVAVN